MKNKVLKYFGVQIVDEWSSECDFFIYEESTADSNSVFVATQNPENITVEENIYCNDSDLSIALYDAILHYNFKNICIDDPEADWINEAMEELSNWIDDQDEK